jgi:hypothetical protein
MRTKARMHAKERDAQKSLVRASDLPAVGLEAADNQTSARHAGGSRIMVRQIDEVQKMRQREPRTDFRSAPALEHAEGSR